MTKNKAVFLMLLYLEMKTAKIYEILSYSLDINY